MLYLYAITTRREQVPEGLAGLDEAPLALVHAGSLSAVVSTVTTTVVTPTPMRMWHHERVVEALMTQGDVIPMRFATILPDAAALVRCLGARHALFSDDLSRVRGCVELGLRVVRMALPPVSTPPENDGLPCPNLLASEKNGHSFEIARRAARLQREALRRRDESIGEIINRSLAEHAVDHVLRVQSGAGAIVQAAYLVAPDQLDTMKKAVRRLIARHRHLHFLCTGPWPPYHFVHGIEPAAAAAA